MKLYIQSVFFTMLLMLFLPFCIDYNLKLNNIDGKYNLNLLSKSSIKYVIFTPISIPVLFVSELGLITNEFKVAIKNNEIYIK